MEFVIKKSDLLRELQTVTGVVEKRAPLPILTNLLQEVECWLIQNGIDSHYHLSCCFVVNFILTSP